MVRVADERDEVSAVGVPARLGVHLRHERADRVDDAEAAALAVLADGRRDAVRRQDADLSGWDLVLRVDEDGAHPLEPPDDVVVVDDLVPDVDRWAMLGQEALDDLDRTVDARAEGPRSSEQHAPAHELASSARAREGAEDSTRRVTSPPPGF